MSERRRRLFDPAEARGPRDAPDVGRYRDRQAPGPQPMSVSVLVARVKDALAAAFPERVAVIGELSNVSRPASGHIYFRLKDGSCQIDCAMWKSRASRLKFEPADGLEVVVEGKVDVYDAQGRLQLYAERITPRGEGALELAFRQLKEKLQDEGLFDADRKKPIPRIPRAIGVVTSGTGAAIRDIQRTLRKRWPAATVYLLPVPVQGEGSAAKVAEAIRLLDASAEHLGIDTLITGRGGGSLEDLWAFNEEPVARAVAAARTPVISGVGHETDVTICDLVADCRAATPTAAAQAAVPDCRDLARQTADLRARARRALLDRLEEANAALAAMTRSSVFRDPLGRVHNRMQHVDELAHRLRAVTGSELAEHRRRLEPTANRLAALHPARLVEKGRARIEAMISRLRWALGASAKRAGERLGQAAAGLRAVHPAGRLKLDRQQLRAAERQLQSLDVQAVLRRGFTITLGPDGRPRKSAAEFSPGDRIMTRLADGEIRSNVADDEASAAPPQARPRSRCTKPPPGPALFDNPGETD
ncbi:MAG: exodeoxyribonuclease VII large subunit [Planctomycetes bacterium]|nr:exodeoxyribonuclease VII large subunit [Planctomycetota bacterium]